MAPNITLNYAVYVEAKFKVIFAEVLVLFFLCINLLLIVTYFRKECFYTTSRYILFAVTLLSDSLLLVVWDILLFLTHLRYELQIWVCIIIFVITLLYCTVTPVTLTAMTLERYVAICMPLRHAELCSARSTVNCIIIIHCISSLPCIAIFVSLFASAPHSYYKVERICLVEVFMLYPWHDYFRAAVNQSYFLIICIIIVFSYVKIMKVAKAASGESKKSSQKGLRTVLLHAFQLLLCLIQLWCPFIEGAIYRINVYGLRDNIFFHVLKNSLSSHKRNLV